MNTKCCILTGMSIGIFIGAVISVNDSYFNTAVIFIGLSILSYKKGE